MPPDQRDRVADFVDERLGFGSHSVSLPRLPAQWLFGERKRRGNPRLFLEKWEPGAA